MSIKGLSWAIQKNCNTPTTKLVLFILSNYADEKNSCFPSEKHLGKLCGISDRQVRRCLLWLKENNFIEIENVEGKSNRYYLNIDSMDTQDHPPRTQTTSNTKDDTKDIYPPINHSSELRKYIYKDKRQIIYEATDNKWFELFWKKYPRKVSKKEAKRIFMNLDEDKKLKVLKAVPIFSESVKNTEEKYIPHPSTWLNQERWEDSLTKKKQTKNNIAG
jgi:hypothetical protein